ncbi:MAG: hypothetical protein KC583_16490, partial [Myxococcales bacterium]|nr:hypothetical protein [Myxococcales bacterium]
MRGVRLGGGDRHNPDGSVWVQAVVDGQESARFPIQVVMLREGVGIYPLGAQPGSVDPEPGAPPPPGEARYDGLYILDGAEQKWYCVEDADCPAGGTCAADRHACVDGNGALQDILPNCDWNDETCSVHRADVRMFLGTSRQLGLRALATYGEFQFGELLEEVPDDWEGPPVPRPLRLEWSIVPGMPDDVVEVDADSGLLTAIGTGRTAVRALLGPQGVDFEVVVYDQYGYNPPADYARGIEPEDGHLVLFSSSHGPARLGTHVTVRVFDLDTYDELAYRPSKYGPQGRRLVENGDELYGGGGCGIVRGPEGEVFLLNGHFAIAYDHINAQQSRGDHQVFFRPPGEAGGDAARRVCHGAYWRDPATDREFLFGFELDGVPLVRIWQAEITDLADGDVQAAELPNAPLAMGSGRTGFNPAVWTDAEGTPWLLFTEQGIPDVTADNQLHFVALGVDAGGLTADFDPADTIATEPTADLDGILEAPGLIVAPVGPTQAPHAFVGNETSISVIDLAAHTLADRIETRWYGWAIKTFALSPDGTKLYALPHVTYPQAPLACDDASDCPNAQGWACEANACTFGGEPVRPGQIDVDHNWFDGSVRRNQFSNHRAAILDLTGDQPIEDTTLWDCFVDDEALCAGLPYRRYGVDLRHTALKKHMLDTLQSGSTGALPAVVGLNVRQMAVTENALVLIGADANDGQGSALANLTDLAIFNIAPADGQHANGVVFRGWRGLPYALQGLSDPFGLRLGERDQVLGNDRVKNAGILYVPGAPPPDMAGDGPPRTPDAPIEDTGEYADAPPPPAGDDGKLLLLSSSHAAAVDGTFDVLRRLNLDTYTETDFDPAVDGAQGLPLVEGEDGTFEGGCGTVRGPDGEIWLFSRFTAIAYDPGTGAQLYDGNYVRFPGGNDVRVCSGAIHVDGDTKLLYGFDSAIEGPAAPIFVADLNALVDGNVDADTIEDPYLEPYFIGNEQYFPRYVQGFVRDGALWFLEKNEPRTAFRNVVHRAAIGADGALTFDPADDIEAEYTGADIVFSGDPAMIVAPFMGADHLFIGNQNSITVYDLSGGAPARVNYNADGDGIQDDLDIYDFGRSITAFTTNPDGTKLYALPYAKSERLPTDSISVPLVGGGRRLQGVDRYRVVVLDLTAGDAEGRPSFDPATNNGNGIDLVYTYLKQYLVDQGVSPGALPPIFLNVRNIAVSDRTLFLIGNDNADGMGSALANLTDLATYDLATGRGHIWRDWMYEGLQNASAAFGFR